MAEHNNAHQPPLSTAADNNDNKSKEPAPLATTIKGEKKDGDDNDDDESQLTLAERYDKAIRLCESSPQAAISRLEQLQQDVARLALFSSNERLEDISTKSLPLLALEHHLAMAYTRLPTTGGPGLNIKARRGNLFKSIDLWASFLQKLETLADDTNGSVDDEIIITPAEREEYHNLLEFTSSTCTTTTNDGSSTTTEPPQQFPAPRREDKIARFRAKQQAQQQVQRLQSLRERRSRIGISPEEVMDDFDEETLSRSVAMTNLLLNKAEALDEWAQSLRELPMIERMVQMEEQRSQMERHSGTAANNHHHNNSPPGMIDSRQRPTAPPAGLQVTHVTLDSGSGQLQFRKEEIKSQVFRPGWNQPTMSLEQFADRERENAIAREQKETEAEANRAQGPRRYDQLLKDGMEDNIEDVDASAALDRAWDDWKDENPKGSGNKRGDQGDRNF